MDRPTVPLPLAALPPRSLATDPISSQALPAPRGRLHDLDRAKGLAILLVVFGHLVAREDPAGVSWYEPLRIAVYLFHMPFFMYLSGYVTFRSGAAYTRPPDWPGLVRRRGLRLLLPFLLFGTAIVLAKLIAAQFAVIDNVPDSLRDGLRMLVWDTLHSPATSVWYIGVLFVYCVAVPPLLWLKHGRFVLAALAIVLYLVDAPPLIYADHISTFLIFFVAGGFAAEAAQRWTRFVDVSWPWALLGLVALCAVVGSGMVTFEWTEGLQGFPYKWWMLAAGLLSMPAVHGLVRNAGVFRSARLSRIGRYTFAIYLMNTPFIGLTKAMLLKVVSWDGAHFLPFAAALMLAGTAGPILVKRLLLRRIPALDRMTD
jgi:fucose 4-O-acetylase-like acetyltransferase